MLEERASALAPYLAFAEVLIFEGSDEAWRIFKPPYTLPEVLADPEVLRAFEELRREHPQPMRRFDAWRRKFYPTAAERPKRGERAPAQTRIHAEMKGGQLYRESQKAKGARGTGSNQHRKVRSQPATAARTLEDLGVSKTQSSRWQQLAENPPLRPTYGERLCPHCQTLFTARSAAAVYCSLACAYPLPRPENAPHAKKRREAASARRSRNERLEAPLSVLTA